ncbi:hypothetical protein C8T65DRAFT_171663 [Cerioporus squamosus]|nr:hypothetical protein C8T65DRAFT_171663 [Cerioporus squamosus]
MTSAGHSPRVIDSSRLPSYSAKHLRRPHPYSMASRPRRGEHLMTTVDYRTGPSGLETIPEEPEPVRLKPVIVYDQSVYDHEQGSLAPAAAESKAKVTNVLLVLRRKLLVLLEVVAYVKGNETKQ